MEFNSHTDRVVAYAVGLVNALTEGERRGRPYRLPDAAARAKAATDALAEALRGTAGPGPLTDSEADELIVVAGELRVVFEAIAAGDIDAAAGQVNRLLDETQARPRLTRHDGESWHVHFHGTGEKLGTEWAGPCATGLAVVIGSELHDRLGVCTAPQCDRVYVDTSRNGTRRFCSTACQNRVKTAAFRARGQA